MAIRAPDGANKRIKRNKMEPRFDDQVQQLRQKVKEEGAQEAVESDVIGQHRKIDKPRGGTSARVESSRS